MMRKLLASVVLLACAGAVQAQPQATFKVRASLQAQAPAPAKVIAHRGYWKPEGSAQNSISSLHNAINAGCYGSEFDVLVTADGVAVVNHDNSIGGFVIEDTPYRKLKNLRLANGEKLSTLKQYLKAGAGQTGTKLILELKPHSTPEKDRAAAAIAIREVEVCGVRDITEYITFSLVAGRELIRLDPTAKVAYLTATGAVTLSG